MLRFFSADDTPTTHLPTPPIDAMVPEHFETATFAVG